jgi:hypothetical protein
MSRARRIAALAILCASSAFPLLAASPGWGVRAGYGISGSSHDWSYSYSGFTSHVQFFDPGGWTIAGELRPWQHVGFELGVTQLRWNAQAYTVEHVPDPPFPPVSFHDEVTFADHGNVTSDTLAAAVLVHPAGVSRFDPYFGAFAGWTRYDIGVDTQDREGDPTWGGIVGMSIGIGQSPWELALEGRWTEYAHSRSSDRDIYGSFNAVTGSLLVGYRFGR